MTPRDRITKLRAEEKRFLDLLAVLDDFEKTENQDWLARATAALKRRPELRADK